MGLPRSIPSGGAGLDTFSEKPAPRTSPPANSERKSASANTSSVAARKPVTTQKPVQTSSERPVKSPPKKVVREEPLPVKSDELSEFQEFQRWKQMKEAGTSQATVTAKKERAPKKPAKQVVENESFVDETNADTNSSLTTRIDPKTGVAYYAIPKTKMGADGRPVLDIDIDIYDLNGEAEAFMAHLRIPPSKEEREELLAKRAEMVRKQKAEKEESDRELEAKYGSLEQEVDPFNEKSAKKRGLFKKKS